MKTKAFTSAFQEANSLFSLTDKERLSTCKYTEDFTRKKGSKGCKEIKSLRAKSKCQGKRTPHKKSSASKSDEVCSLTSLLSKSAVDLEKTIEPNFDVNCDGVVGLVGPPMVKPKTTRKKRKKREGSPSLTSFQKGRDIETSSKTRKRRGPKRKESNNSSSSTAQEKVKSNTTIPDYFPALCKDSSVHSSPSNASALHKESSVYSCPSNNLTLCKESSLHSNTSAPCKESSVHSCPSYTSAPCKESSVYNNKHCTQNSTYQKHLPMHTCVNVNMNSRNSTACVCTTPTTGNSIESGPHEDFMSASINSLNDQAVPYIEDSEAQVLEELKKIEDMLSMFEENASTGFKEYIAVQKNDVDTHYMESVQGEIDIIEGKCCTVEPLYKGHIGTLETVLYIEVVLNSEVIL